MASDFLESTQKARRQWVHALHAEGNYTQHIVLYPATLFSVCVD